MHEHGGKEMEFLDVKFSLWILWYISLYLKEFFVQQIKNFLSYGWKSCEGVYTRTSNQRVHGIKVSLL